MGRLGSLLVVAGLLCAGSFAAACGGSTSCPAGSSLDPASGRCIAGLGDAALDAGQDGSEAPDGAPDASQDAGDGATVADSAVADSALADSALADSAVADSALADSAVADACTPATYYADADGDGFGDPASTVDACTMPSGFVEDSTDCDDMAMAVHPGASEVCDGVVDENCNGTVDEGCSCTDGDSRACGMSVGECRQGAQTCTAGGWGACAGAIGPTAESCNGLDDDCDGATDEDLTPPDICFSAGVCAGTLAICRAARFVCDYSAVANYQAGDESRCDGLDNDCDGMADETLKIPYYRDNDGDGFGDPAMTRSACPGSPPAGYVRNRLDCNDACPTCFNGAPELCDGLDNNCNGSTDEGATLPFYHDYDGDGHGTGAIVQRCSGGAGWSTVGDDCWDEAGSLSAAAALVHPGQSAYFTTYRADVSTFDYNCNGSDEKHWTTTWPNCNASCVGEGWTSGTPACGARGTFRTCGYDTSGSCSAPSETRWQECR